MGEEEKLTNVDTDEQDKFKNVFQNNYDKINDDKKIEQISGVLESSLDTGTPISPRAPWVKVFSKLLVILIVAILVLVAYSSISVSPGNLNFELEKGESGSDYFQISNSGKEIFKWRAYSDEPWISISPKGDTNSDLFYVKVNTAGLKPGLYEGNITIKSSIKTEHCTVNLRLKDKTEIYSAAENGITGVSGISELPENSSAADDNKTGRIVKKPPDRSKFSGSSPPADDDITRSQALYEPTTEENVTDKDYLKDYLEKYEQLGQIIFSPSEKMKVGETQIVKAYITGNTSENILKTIGENKTLESMNINVTPRMKVTLYGEKTAFDINSLASDVQPISGERITTWQWKVTPKIPGKQTLMLNIEYIISPSSDGITSDLYTYKSLEKKIEVEVIPMNYEFNPTENMTFDNTETVCANISKSENITISPRVRVILKEGEPETFDIYSVSPDSNGVQSIVDEKAAWSWKVTPKKPGNHNLILIVGYVIENNPDIPIRKIEKEIKVEGTLFGWIKALSITEYLGIIASILGSLLTIWKIIIPAIRWLNKSK